MHSRNLATIFVLTLATGFIGCASAPPTVPDISSTANPATEIDKTQQMINEARDRQIDVLSPTNFSKAEDSLKSAIKKRDAGKSNADIIEQVAYSRGYLKEALAKSEIATMQMKDIQDARRGALNAKANESLPKEWASTGKELESVTKDIEKGNIKPAEKKGPDIVAKYRKLEKDAVMKMALGKADDNIKIAEKDNAKKVAPKSYELTTMKYDNAAKIIAANPRNSAAINKAAADATAESVHLVDIVGKVKQGNTEDLVLQAERQQRAITSLSRENRSTEHELNQMERQQAELKQSQALINQAAAIRRQFKPNEAEVFPEGGRVTIRLKALQFPVNQATLGPRNQELLEKVNEAISQAGPSKVIVERHTDSTGSAEKNMTLSERRAKSVQDYLVANGAVTLDNVESVGLGATKPVSDNKTSAGRAQNRRIDIIVEPIQR